MGGIAGRSRTVDRASWAANYQRDSGKRSDAAGGTIAPARAGIGSRALGASAGIRGVWGTEGGHRTSAGAHAKRSRSETGQLPAVARRRAPAARGAGRNRRGTYVAKLSPVRTKRGGGLRDREVQREPGVCGGQRVAVTTTVREETGRPGPGGDHD